MVHAMELFIAALAVVTVVVALERNARRNRRLLTARPPAETDRDEQRMLMELAAIGDRRARPDARRETPRDGRAATPIGVLTPDRRHPVRRPL